MSNGLMQSVAKLAQQSFTTKVSNEGLQRLRCAMSKLTAKDVNYDVKNVDKLHDSAPVLYTHIYLDNVMSIGIFTIRENKSIPLHDHPGMFGFIKVIQGRASIKSYTPLSDMKPTMPEAIAKRIPRKYQYLLVPTIADPELIVSSEDELCGTLTPEIGNIHEIKAVGGISAFVDILAPPHSEDVEYLSYSNLGVFHDNQYQRDITWMVKIPMSQDFYTGTLPYNGPPI